MNKVRLQSERIVNKESRKKENYGQQWAAASD